MTSEDFSYFSQSSDVCFYRLGVRNVEQGITSPVHTPTFNIDEDALETGVGLMSWMTINQLNN
jgi:metal-dependent amidase/aminoacylase/carboxypeptidase family protein